MSNQQIQTANRIEFRLSPLPSPAGLRDRVKQLSWERDHFLKSQKMLSASCEEIDGYLRIADDVTAALETLSSALFKELVGALEDKLTVALQDIIEQPIAFRATPKSQRNATVLEFSIERDGNMEDVKRAQGGSVQNILSVGLRLFALASLSQEHRGFLVLDEQDCWLRPELVPKLVQIVHQAGRELGFQVLMISHHDTRLFDSHADKMYTMANKEGRVEMAEYLFKPTGPNA
jgi:DNA repair exonuclease SbcCD ATPase subunit